MSKVSTGLQEINESEMIKIGGVDQYITYQGKDNNNPVLLFLHGGPGATMIPLASFLPKALTENFIVAHWDQRGAGKSYSQNIPDKTMNLEQFVSDAIEVVDYISKKFNKEKIYLLGLSWGSVIGINVVYKHPEKFYAYIGTGQIIDIQKGDKLSYHKLLQLVKDENNEEALNELLNIGEPPFDTSEKFITFMKWSQKLKLTQKNINIFDLYSQTCNEEELQLVIEGAKYSNSNLVEELATLNINHIKSINLPVYFCQGIDDYETPTPLVESFYNSLEAKHKDFILFKESEHTAIFEEPEKFGEVLIKIKKETYK